MPKPDQQSQMAWAWLHIHAALGRTWKQGVQVLRIDWPVYPRRAKHNTIAKGGIEDGPRLRGSSGRPYGKFPTHPPSLPTAAKAANAGGAYPDVRADPWPKINLGVGDGLARVLKEGSNPRHRTGRESGAG